MKLSVFVATIVIFLTGSLHAETLRVGYFIVPPHVIMDGKKNLSGSAVAFFNEKIAPAMGVTVKWAKSPSPVPRLQKQLQDGKLDVGLVFAKNPTRLKYLNFPKNNFFESSSIIALLKTSPVTEVNSIEDILNLKIGYGRGSFKTPFMRDKRIKFELVSGGRWIETNFKKLMANRIDAFYQPERPTLLYYAKQFEVGDRVRIINLPERTKIYSTFSKKSDSGLTARYDKAFVKSGGTATYIKYLSRYIDVSKL